MDFDAFDFFRLAFDEDKRCMSSCLMTAQRHRHIASMRWHTRQVNDERRGRIAETIAKRLGSGLAVINLVSGGAQFGDLLFGFFGFPVNQAYTMHIRFVSKSSVALTQFARRRPSRRNKQKCQCRPARGQAFSAASRPVRGGGRREWRHDASALLTALSIFRTD